MAGCPLFLLWFLATLSLLSAIVGFPSYSPSSTSDSPPRRRPPPLPVLPVPSASQLSWQLGEMAMFLHFGPNTFTDSEWGSGRVDPGVFNPADLDARQWTRAAAEGGFSRLVITAKHHDGFCLWPSAYTNYSVRSSPWRAGRGIEAGVGMGIYLSPWDRHEPCYGKTTEYNEYFLGQMAELLTGYGEIKEVFLDGAKGKDSTDMEYFFDSWFKVIHQHQPRLRWVGNEAGAAGRTCWSLFNQSDVAIGHTTEYSSEGDPVGRDWVPAECDVSIRPGWFWHSKEQPKSAADLLEIYYSSVGRNCFLILNVPPIPRFSKLRRTIFSQNLAQDAVATASSTRGGGSGGDPSFGASCVLQEGIFSYWAPEEGGGKWEILLDLRRPVRFNVFQVQEPIQMGQRISSFHVDAIVDGAWETIAYGTTVGYKRLLRLPLVESQYLRLVIDGARADPLVSYMGIYLDEFSTIHHWKRMRMPSGSKKSHLLRQPASMHDGYQVAM
ncbi:unnamed protein product [Spirodela intermedia]|uniref:alpha-L-fucosidase n=1 Tax=Spirodela intermedia TaxID=51605 RepID=A0A7I8IEL8_SPIIN|nr:unnamed protein product [Spirodela intermedia]CAA6655543.1 unnamed protein product [Spirodela intermedia]